MKKYINKLNNEMWLCENINDTVDIDGILFVKVTRPGNSDVKLITKDCLVEVLNNNDQYNGSLING
jgi:hypothetical protein